LGIRPQLEHRYRSLRVDEPLFKIVRDSPHQLFEPRLQWAERVSSVGEELLAAIRTAEFLIHALLVKAGITVGAPLAWT
jgi:hypothetical protein